MPRSSRKCVVQHSIVWNHVTISISTYKLWKYWPTIIPTFLVNIVEIGQNRKLLSNFLSFFANGKEDPGLRCTAYIVISPWPCPKYSYFIMALVNIKFNKLSSVSSLRAAQAASRLRSANFSSSYRQKWDVAATLSASCVS